MAKNSKVVPPSGYQPQQPFSEAAPKHMASSSEGAMQALEEKRNKTRRKKARLVFVVIGILVLLALLGAFLVAKKLSSNQRAVQNPVAPVERMDFSKTITTSGTIQPIAHQSVSPLFNGEVTSIKVEAGSEVKPGDVLFTFKSEEVEKQISDAEKAVQESQNGVKQAQSAVRQAINSYNRAVDQYNMELDAAQAAQNEAARQQAIARANQIAAQEAAQAASLEAANRASVVAGLMQQYQDASNKKLLFDQLVASGKAERGMSFKEAQKLLEDRRAAGAQVAWAQSELEKAKQNQGGAPYADEDRIATIDKHWLNKIVIKSQLKAMGIDPDNSAAPGDMGATPGGFMSEGTQELAAPGNAGTSLSQILPFDKEGAQAPIESAQFGVVSAKLAAQTARENLQLVKEKYNNGVVEATIAGQVVALNIEVGSKLDSLIQAGKPAIQIADVSKMKAGINVNEIDILRVNKDTKATMSFSAIPNYETTGLVESIASSPGQAEQNGDSPFFGGFGGGQRSGSSLVSYPVGVVLENPDPRIKVGMTTEVTLLIEDIKDALTVPLDALNNDGEKDYVNVVTLDGAGTITDRRRVYVEVISSNETVNVIKDDGSLSPDDQVEVFKESDSGFPGMG